MNNLTAIIIAFVVGAILITVLVSTGKTSTYMTAKSILTMPQFWLVIACAYIVIKSIPSSINLYEGYEEMGTANTDKINVVTDDHVKSNLTINELIEKAEKEHEGVDRQTIQSSLQAKSSNQLPITPPSNTNNSEEPVSSEGFSASRSSINYSSF